jgi:hypothetical protein
MFRKDARSVRSGREILQSATRNRKLRLERFEIRALFAADCLHNIEIPEDADGSGDVSALDALAIINQLNGNSTSSAELMTDVDTDSMTTPLDALAVINHLNRHGGERAPSSISPQARIARIEQSIAGGTLASAFSLEDAIDVLAILRSGQRPEMGERDANILRVSPPKSEHVPSTDRFVEKLTAKLTNAGVATETIETISTEIRSAADASAPLTLAQIKTRLEELGVDTTTIFPAKPNHPAGEDRFLTRLTTQLTAAGVDVALIETITQEIKDAKAAGDRWNASEIESRLVELGVDVSTIDLTPQQRGDRSGFRAKR